MEEQKVIASEFDNKFYAEIAKRDLIAMGINTNIFKNYSDLFLSLMNQNEEVQLIIPETQIDEYRKILEIKFI